MNKNIIVAIVIIAVLAVGGYFYWTKWRGGVSTPQQQAVEDAAKAIDEASKNVTENVTQGVLPTIETPDTNPVTKTNPFSNVKTNPFQ